MFNFSSGFSLTWICMLSMIRIDRYVTYTLQEACRASLHAAAVTRMRGKKLCGRGRRVGVQRQGVFEASGSKALLRRTVSRGARCRIGRPRKLDRPFRGGAGGARSGSRLRAGGGARLQHRRFSRAAVAGQARTGRPVRVTPGAIGKGARLPQASLQRRSRREGRMRCTRGCTGGAPARLHIVQVGSVRAIESARGNRKKEEPCRERRH